MQKNKQESEVPSSSVSAKTIIRMRKGQMAFHVKGEDANKSKGRDNT